MVIIIDASNKIPFYGLTNEEFNKLLLSGKDNVKETLSIFKVLYPEAYSVFTRALRNHCDPQGNVLVIGNPDIGKETRAIEFLTSQNPPHADLLPQDIILVAYPIFKDNDSQVKIQIKAYAIPAGAGKKLKEGLSKIYSSLPGIAPPDEKKKQTKRQTSREKPKNYRKIISALFDKHIKDIILDEDANEWIETLKIALCEIYEFHILPKETEEFTSLASTLLNISLLIDKTGRKKPSLILSSESSYDSLFIRCESRDEEEAQFHNAIGGDLLKAHRGYIFIQDGVRILNDEELIEKLTGVLKTKKMPVEYKTSDGKSRIFLDAYVPCDARVFMHIGWSEWLWMEINESNPDPENRNILKNFMDQFKEKALFDEAVEFGKDSKNAFALIMNSIIQSENLPPLENASAFNQILFHYSKKAESQTKIHLDIKDLKYFLNKVADIAKTRGGLKITAEDIDAYLKEKQKENAFFGARHLQIVQDYMLFQPQSPLPGTAYGVGIKEIKDWTYATYLRFTCKAEIVPGTSRKLVIEPNETPKTLGASFQKAINNLRGYFNYIPNTYKNFKFDINVKLSIEEHNMCIEGDSASVAIAIAIRSALSGIALKPNVFFTGSMDQYGHIQAIGGVNEKIRWIYNACVSNNINKAAMFIPEKNYKDLLLEQDIKSAIDAGDFKIVCCSIIDEVWEEASGISVIDCEKIIQDNIAQSQN